MSEPILILLPILLPILSGIVLLFPGKWERKKICLYTGIFLLLSFGAVLTVVFGFSTDTELTVLWLTKTLPIYFKIDAIGKMFAMLVTIVWVCSGLFSFIYMKHEWKEKRFFGFYLIVYGVLIGLDFAGNLITFYIFYEFMTLMSVPLVLHSGTKEAIMAGLKYLFYSLCGAYMSLLGIYFLSRYCNTNALMFSKGGILDFNVIAGHENLILIIAFFMILGFGVKAGMFPMHAWLTLAHPEAPAPASAVLSGIIVKSGILALIRVIYFVFGTEILRGTWVQYAWLILALITIFMGSLLAYREKGLKKRLAYSTVSQISYILLGLGFMNQVALTGAILHTICHAFTKSALFLIAGAMIFKTGKTRVDEYAGIGKRMPITMLCFTAASFALIGIPPAGGFISKWYLALGALQSQLNVFSWLGPVILLISALLTAGYLLPIVIRGFFPGEGYIVEKREEPELLMILPIIILSVLCVGVGVFPTKIIEFVNQFIVLM